MHDLFSYLIPYILTFIWVSGSYGLGKLICNGILEEKKADPALSLLIGVSFPVLIGGFLTAIGIFQISVMWTLAIVGCLFIIITGTRRPLPEGFYVNLIPLVILGVYLIHVRFVPDFLNFHDDFEKYLTHPIRLIQTGTLQGGPLNALGTETLGGLAVIQAMLVPFLPVASVNGVDAVWGVLLTYMVMAASLPAMKPAKAWLIRLGTVFFLILLDPYYANVSALWFGIFIMSGLGLSLMSRQDKATPREIGFWGIALGCLLAMKSSFAPFALAMAVSLFWGHPQRLKMTGVLLGGIFLSLLPWILLVLPNIILGISQEAIPTLEQEPRISFSHMFVEIIHNPFFIPPFIFWVVSGILIGLRRSEKRFALLPVLLWIGWPLLLLAGPLGNGVFSHLRYAYPLLISLILVLFFSPGRKGTFAGTSLDTVSIILLAVCLINTAGWRLYRTGSESGMATEHFFPMPVSHPEVATYMQKTLLSGETREHLRKVQALVPPGEPILAGVNANFLLDFERNPIDDFDPAGVHSPWAHLPATSYFLIQKSGPGVRTQSDWISRAAINSIREQTITQKAIALQQLLRKRQNEGSILWEDSQYILFYWEESP